MTKLTDMPTYRAWLETQGWHTNDLARAIELHGIKGEKV